MGRPGAGYSRPTMPTPQTLQTERLRIRPFTEDDAAFILELVNDADWLRFIGDKNVRSLDDARRYLRDGPLAMLARYGHALGCVERRSDGQAIGMCGLLKRDSLDDVDLGFAFLPAARGQGYAREAAAAVVGFGFGTLVSQIGTMFYFGFFLLMPWWSRIGEFKAVPDRVTFQSH